jgi:hypothetical protein
MSTVTPTEPPKINELAKFMMYTPNPNNPTRRSRLVWAIRDGNPRITIWTNDPTDKEGRGAITAPMNPETFFIFLDAFEEIIKGEPNKKMSIENLTSVRDDKAERNPNPEKIVLSKLFFGKDEQGMAWLSVLSAESDARPRLKFTFRLSEYHKVFRSDGAAISESEASCLHAAATIRAIRSIYTQNVNSYKLPYDKNAATNSYGPKKIMDAKAPAKPVTDFDDLSF